MISADDIRAHLSAQRFGRDLVVLAETDSTNSDAARLAREGAVEGTVVLAESQRRGRGRLGRQWASPPGCNLYVSIVLRPSVLVSQVPLLTLVAGVACAETVAEFAGKAVAIKWPNDVVVRGRKLAGILCEMESDLEGRVAVVAGIGVNANSLEEDFPPELRSAATSVRLTSGRPVDRAELCGRLLSHLEARYDTFMRDGFAAIAPEWEKWNGLAGHRIRVQDGAAVIEGRVRGLAADGCLEVDTEAGVRRIVAGDVAVLDGYAELRAEQREE